MKTIRRNYTVGESRDYYRVHGNTSMLTDSRSIIFRATTEWGREYAYFDLDEDRKMSEYNRLAVKRRIYGKVRLDRYHYYDK